MTAKRVALFVISISSLLIWDLLIIKNLLGGKMETILVILSLLPFVYSSFLLLNDFRFESSYFKFIITVFFCYEAVIVARGWSFAYEDIKTYIQDGSILWPFIVPVFIFFNKKLITFGYFFKWIYISGIFFLVVGIALPTLLIYRITAETFVYFALPCGFLLLNATYLSNKKVNLSLFALSLSILSLTYLARRSGLITLLGFVAAGYLINRSSASSPKLFRLLPFIVIIAAFVLFNQNFENIKDMLFNKLVYRISEDTRSNLFDMFFKQMKEHMIFGKGMNATYYFPFLGFEVDGVFYGKVEWRHIIENGWLQLLLTGGIVHIVLYVLVLLPGAILGFFKSANMFVKACSVVILLRMLDMFFYGMPSLNLPYILVWICVGVCYKTSLRKMTNDEIMVEIKKIDLR